MCDGTRAVIGMLSESDVSESELMGLGLRPPIRKLRGVGAPARQTDSNEGLAIEGTAFVRVGGTRVEASEAEAVAGGRTRCRRLVTDVMSSQMGASAPSRSSTSMSAASHCAVILARLCCVW